VNTDVGLSILGALLCLGLALGVLIVRGTGLSARLFAAGMCLFATEQICQAFSFGAVTANVALWQSWALVVKAAIPGVWIAFSGCYSRGDGASYLKRWKWLLLGGTILPVAFAIAFQSELFVIEPISSGDSWLHFTLAGKALNGFLLLGAVVVLMNLEQTFRSAVGMARWRIKFVVLGAAAIFGVRIYTRSQVLLYSGHELALLQVESAGMLLGGILILFGSWRRGFRAIDLYPSRAVLQSSITVLLVGAYLVTVGILGQIANYLGISFSFRLAALVILVGLVGVALVLFSGKARHRLGQVVSRHLRRPQYDFRAIWSQFTEATAGANDPVALSAAVARMISETFHVLSVSIWLLDEENGQLVLGASTAGSEGQTREEKLPTPEPALLQSLTGPVDLDAASDGRVRELAAFGRKRFREGGHQVCVPLRARGRCRGIAILSDRVRGNPYTSEEFDLLACLADQIAARLMNFQAASELIARKELETLQTVTAFFVHDLKNATSTLRLMLANLPVHFNDPSFREDAMRGIRGTIARIEELISRAGSLRAEFELKPTECDLNALVAESLRAVNGKAELEWISNLHPLPPVVADRERIQSVITNLLLNASEANGTSRITVETEQLEEWASLEVADNGCGMSAAFVKESLFRPFRTTKKKGMGIGMFQSKMIVEAHRGKMLVKTEPGVGTTFRVLLPIESRS
jgi:putative PEP-CTERM system histidine kinase